MGKRVYLICPVTNCPADTRRKMDEYVKCLEDDGCVVHYPPRDVEQSKGMSEHYICTAHLKAMLEADEVHAWWDSSSKGSHFDFGMAYMLANFKGIKFVLANDPPSTEWRSYGNYYKLLASVGKKEHNEEST